MKRHDQVELADYRQICALVTLAAAQPLYDLIGREPTFLAARGSDWRDLILLVACLQLFLPGLVWLMLKVFGLITQRLGGRIVKESWVSAIETGFRAGSLGLLVALVATPILERTAKLDGAFWWLALLAIASFGGWLLVRFQVLRRYLRIFGTVALLFALAFLFRPSIARFLPQSRESQPTQLSEQKLSSTQSTPFILLVLDELPLASLLDPESVHGSEVTGGGGSGARIDSQLYPNIAEFSQASTWYRNATTPSTTTRFAVPAILTGNVAHDVDKVPTEHDYPDNLLAWLDSSHALHAAGSFVEFLVPGATATGPGFLERAPILLEDCALLLAHIWAPTYLEQKLAPVDQNWMHFGAQLAQPAEAETPEQRRLGWLQRLEDSKFNQDRAQQFESFLASIEGWDSETPKAQPPAFALHCLLPHAPWWYLPDGKTYPGPKRELNANVALQRHLLQLGFVDRLVGRLLETLRTQGLYDSALIVITSDHGTSFRSAQQRRRLTQDRLRDVAHVPLFIKYPTQSSGRTDDRNALLHDLVPTLAEVWSRPLPWTTEGQSLLGPARSSKLEKSLASDPSREPLRFSAALPDDWPLLQLRREHYGSHAKWNDLYAPQVHDLLGKPTSGLLSKITKDRIRWAESSQTNSQQEPWPRYLEGSIQLEDSYGHPRAIAAISDGIFQAAALTRRRDGEVRFTLLLPELPTDSTKGWNFAASFDVQLERWAPLESE